MFNRPVNLPAGMLGGRKNKVLLLEPTERTNIKPAVLIAVGDVTIAGAEDGSGVTIKLRATPIVAGYQLTCSSNSS